MGGVGVAPGVGGVGAVGGVGGVAVPGVVVPGVGVGGFGDGRFNGGFGGRGRNDFDGRGRNDFDGRGRDDFDGRGDGRFDDFGGRGDDDGGRNIDVQPRAIAAGNRITVTVNNCRSGTMTSRAFHTAQLFPFGGDMARGVATIERNASPGPYDLTVRCDGRTFLRRDAFFVIGGTRSGLGGSISSGATPADMAVGGGLVGAAVLAGCGFWLRRRHEKRI
ncbi:hypothetical protein ACFV23_30965 [Streptomyces sp. NPDC059627]